MNEEGGTHSPLLQLFFIYVPISHLLNLTIRQFTDELIWRPAKKYKNPVCVCVCLLTQPFLQSPSNPHSKNIFYHCVIFNIKLNVRTPHDDAAAVKWCSLDAQAEVRYFNGRHQKLTVTTNPSLSVATTEEYSSSRSKSLLLITKSLFDQNSSAVLGSIGQQFTFKKLYITHLVYF